MSILADVEVQAIENACTATGADQEYLKARYRLRTLSPDQAFHFAGESGYTGHVAYDLDQFSDLIAIIPSDSLTYHIKNQDFTRWIRGIVSDASLADQIKHLTSREEMMECVERRCKELWRA
jgi:hypothetical protein